MVLPIIFFKRGQVPELMDVGRISEQRKKVHVHVTVPIKLGIYVYIYICMYMHGRVVKTATF